MTLIIKTIILSDTSLRHFQQVLQPVELRVNVFFLDVFSRRNECLLTFNRSSRVDTLPHPRVLLVDRNWITPDGWLARSLRRNSACWLSDPRGHFGFLLMGELFMHSVCHCLLLCWGHVSAIIRTLPILALLSLSILSNGGDSNFVV